MFSKSNYTVFQNKSKEYSFCHAIADYLVNVAGINCWNYEAVKNYVNMTDFDIRDDNYKTVLEKLHRCGIQSFTLYRDVNSKLAKLNMFGPTYCDSVPIRVSDTGHYDLVSSKCNFRKVRKSTHAENCERETDVFDRSERQSSHHETPVKGNFHTSMYETPVKGNFHTSMYETPEHSFREMEFGAPVKRNMRDYRVGDLTFSKLADRLDVDQVPMSPKANLYTRSTESANSRNQERRTQEVDFIEEPVEINEQHDDFGEQIMDETRVRKSDVISARREYYGEMHNELHHKHTRICRDIESLQREFDKNSLLLSEIVCVIFSKMRTVMSNENGEDRYAQHTTEVSLDMSHFMIDQLSRVKWTQEEIRKLIRELESSRAKIEDEMSEIQERLESQNQDSDEEDEDGDHDGDDEEDGGRFEENSTSDEEEAEDLDEGEEEDDD